MKEHTRQCSDGDVIVCCIYFILKLLHFAFDQGLINYVTECYIDEMKCVSGDKQDEKDRDEPDRGEPDRGEPDRGEPDRGEPDRGEPDADQHESDELTKMKESIDLIR